VLRDKDCLASSVANNEGTSGEFRSYGVGAQILKDLGVSNMILLTNNKKSLKGLEGYGLHIADQIAISGKAGA
jgi:3,4-dihydroxy 2-butanone 4-phosphate synthase/GTP cyclohydrolase II